MRNPKKQDENRRRHLGTCKYEKYKDPSLLFYSYYFVAVCSVGRRPRFLFPRAVLLRSFSSRIFDGYVRRCRCREGELFKSREGNFSSRMQARGHR